MQKHLNTVLTGAVLVALLIVGVTIALRATAPAPAPSTLVLYCDEALAAVMDDIVNAFQRRSDVRVEVRYAPASDLYSRDEGNASVLVVKGDEFLPDGVMAIAETRTVAWALPVILVRDGNPHGIQSVYDLVRPEIAVGVAARDQTALGNMTPTIFAHFELDEEALMASVVFTSTTGADLGNAVRMGRIDAALVWEPMAHGALRTDFVRIPLSENLAAPVTVGLLAGASPVASALEFLDFLQGRAAQSLFDRYHYTVSTPW